MIITVGNEKGGVGKSRLATHIAALAAFAGVDVILLDTDAQGSATGWSQIRNEAGVVPSISVLSLPTHPARELAHMAARHELVVVDIAAQSYRTMVDCALLSDLVLIPCGADQQEVDSTLRVFDLLRSKDAGHETGKIPAHVVLTRVSHNEKAKTTLDLRDYYKSLDVPVLKSQLAYRTSWTATGKSGRTVQELRGSERSQKAIDEMQAVYAEVYKLMTGKTSTTRRTANVAKPKKETA